MCAAGIRPRSSGFVARCANHLGTRPGHALLKITVHIEEIIQVLVSFIFVSKVNCVHHSISTDLHVSLFGTEPFSYEKKVNLFFRHTLSTLFC